MAKLALCINRADAPQAVLDAFASGVGALVPIPSEFWNTPVHLAGRAYCETNESLLQLLPYIPLVDEDSSCFMYTRGGGGEEARLHGNYSIGVGGHVDCEPAAGQTLLEVLQEEAAREAKEETGLVIDPASFNITHFIVDPTNSVGRVHLGLLTSHSLSKENADTLIGTLEAGTIENSRMVSLVTLHTQEVYNRLENWSKLVANALLKRTIDAATADEGAGDTSFALPAGEEDYSKDAEDEECSECDQPADECICGEDEEYCEDCDSSLEDCQCDGENLPDNESDDEDSAEEEGEDN